MAWESSDRRKRLPKDWEKIRRRVLIRDGYRCRAANANTGLRCDEEANQVDHINRRAGDDDWNLQALCEWHHGQKSAREGAQERAEIYRRNASKFSRKEKHPGAI